MRSHEIVVIDTGHTREDGNADLKLNQPSLKEAFCDP